MSERRRSDLQSALRGLGTPSAPERIWQRIERSLDGEQQAAAQRRSAPLPLRRAVGPAASLWRGRWIGLLAACCAALFLWFEGLQHPGPEPQPLGGSEGTVADVNHNVLQLQQLSARLENELNLRRARSTRYDDDMALREAMLSSALGDIDQALAVTTDRNRERALWTQRVALLAGLNEQATDPLPLGRVDWVQVD